MSGLDNFVGDVQNEEAESTAKNAGISDNAEVVLDAFEVARFWSRVEVRKREQCWPWRRGSDGEGYGDFRLADGSRSSSHRTAYRIGNGAIETGLLIRHTCDNRLCCNPRHLIKGVHEDNVADRVERGRSAKGETHGRHKLTEFEVKLIRSSPLSESYFANRFKVHEDTIRDVRSRRTWAHV